MSANIFVLEGGLETLVTGFGLRGRSQDLEQGLAFRKGEGVRGAAGMGTCSWRRVMYVC